MDSKKIDYDELHKAKQLLISSIWSSPLSKLWLIVELINEVQADAVNSGNWSFPPRGRLIRKSSALNMKPTDGDLCWDVERATGMEWVDGSWQDISYTIWLQQHTEEELV